MSLSVLIKASKPRAKVVFSVEEWIQDMKWEPNNESKTWNKEIMVSWKDLK